MKTFANFLLLACGLLLTLNANAQNWNNWGPGIKGEGPIVKKTLSLDAFSGVELAVSGNVYIRQGSKQMVEVESHQNIIELLRTDVASGFWKIRFDKSVRGYSKLNIYITVPSVSKLAISGSGRIEGQNTFTGSNNVSLAISGSGNLKAAFECQELSATISGSGDMILSGKTGSLRASISGSGDVRAKELDVADANITISGSGDCSVSVRENLDVKTSGSGDVSYSGRPRVNAKVSGSGKVRAQE